MTTSLAPRAPLLPDAQTWQTQLSMADALYRSGLLPTHIRSAQAAVAIIQKGSELGIPPMAALSSISVINGKPVCSAELMLALLYRDHGDQAVVIEETTAEACRLRYKRRGWPSPRAFAWTADDAERAGLLGQKGPWSQYTPAMLRARCISAVARLAFPDSIGGLYTAEELGAEVTVTSDGDIVPVEPPARVTVLRDDPAPETAREPSSGHPAGVSEPLVRAEPMTRAGLLRRARRGRAFLREHGVEPGGTDEELDWLEDAALLELVERLRERARAITAADAHSDDRAQQLEAWRRIFFGTLSGTWLADDEDARHAWIADLSGGQYRSLVSYLASLETVEGFQALMRTAQEAAAGPPPAVEVWVDDGLDDV